MEKLRKEKYKIDSLHEEALANLSDRVIELENKLADK